MSEPAELRPKSRAKVLAVCCIERAITQPVIRAFEGDDAALARREHRRLERGLDRFKTRIAKNGFGVACRAWRLRSGTLNLELPRSAKALRGGE